MGNSMTETTQTPESGPANSERDVAVAQQKSRSRWTAIVLLSLVIALVVLPTLWAVHVALELSRVPVTFVRPHDYETALEQVLALQALALSEAEADPPAFFVSHIGCAAPLVWQNKDVLENFKRMRAAGVEVTLLVGRKGNRGQPLPSPGWPYEFRDELMATLDLDEHGVDEFLHIRQRELYNYSVVAGSERRSWAYIASHEEKSIYPTTYFIVKDNEACQEWKRYLLAKVLTP